MKGECNIIKDILPLYVEDIVSEDTAAFVEEHINHCDDCLTKLEELQKQNVLDTGRESSIQEDTDALKAFKKEWSRNNLIKGAKMSAITFICILVTGTIVPYTLLLALAEAHFYYKSPIILTYLGVFVILSVLCVVAKRRGVLALYYAGAVISSLISYICTPFLLPSEDWGYYFKPFTAQMFTVVVMILMLLLQLFLGLPFRKKIKLEHFIRFAGRLYLFIIGAACLVFGKESFVNPIERHFVNDWIWSFAALLMSCFSTEYKTMSSKKKMLYIVWAVVCAILIMYIWL